MFDENEQKPIAVTDILLSVTGSLEKKLPDDYFTKEGGLPVVDEARKTASSFRSEGKFIESEQKIKSDRVTFYFSSDMHIPGAEPEHSSVERHKVFSPLEKIGIRTIKAEAQNIKPDGKPKELAWTRSIRPMIPIDSARSIMDTISKDVSKQISKNQDKDLSVVIFDNGDSTSTESTIADTALSTIDFVTAVKEIENPDNPHLKIFAGKTLGNHDADPHNKGLEGEIFQRELWGSQISKTDITNGENTVTVISVNTNLESDFWKKHFNLRMETEKSKGVLSERVKKLAEEIQKEKKRQKSLLENLSEIDNPIVIVGHDGEILKKMLPDNLEKTNIACLVTAHTHKRKNESTKMKSKKGYIREITTAPTLRGIPGSEKVQRPTVAAIDIELTSDQPIKFREIEVEVTSDALI